MRITAEDYHPNLQIMLNSTLPLRKKSVLNGIAEQLGILCDKK